MKILNFSAIEILPSLLNKSKQQTIRPAWKEYKDNKGVEFLKPPRFKVGEVVKLVWNQRSKYKWFWRGYICMGKSMLGEEVEQTQKILPHHRKWHFNKLLGTAEITEVFKIEMDRFKLKMPHPSSFFEYKVDDWSRFGQASNYLAKRDGFNSAEELFTYFDKKYNLSQAKEFWVYRWKWIE